MNGRRWSTVGAATALGGLLALGLLWALDRARPWEAPRWEPRRFTLLEDRAPGCAAPAGTWVVPVHPACPHCRVSLGELLAIRERTAAPILIAALVVDAPRPPERAAFGTLPADRLWWDARGIWRHRWGRRVYGEVLCFDAAGTFERELSPLAPSPVRAPAAPGKKGEDP